MAQTTVATLTSTPLARGETTDALDETYLLASIEYTRSLVSSVPGSGPLRGVWLYNDVVYAFRDDELGLACVMFKGTVDGWVEVTTPVLLPGGRYEFHNFNFGGHASTNMMYGCDGVNKAFQFDGTTFTQITTGMTTDTPNHIIPHKNHLFLSFSGGSVQLSSLGDPLTWTPLTGAAELGMGQDVVGFQKAPGDVLAIFARNKTAILYGADGTWELKTHSDESGAIEWSIQRFLNPLYMDDRGLTSLPAVQDFGDFSSKTFSQKVKKLVDAKKGLITGSVRIREKDQYRVYFSDGTFMTFSFDNEKAIGVSRGEYDVQVLVPVSIEDSTGQELILFGCTDGYVYRMDSGNSFDGSTVESWIRPIFHHFRSPENKKRFFKIVLEIDADKSADMTFLPDFSYADPNLPQPIEGDLTVNGGGGIWDSGDLWSSFYWDAQIISTAYGYIDGIGRNLSLFIRAVELNNPPHTIQGATIHYSVRGINR